MLMGVERSNTDKISLENLSSFKENEDEQLPKEAVKDPCERLISNKARLMI